MHVRGWLCSFLCALLFAAVLTSCLKPRTRLRQNRQLLRLIDLPADGRFSLSLTTRSQAFTESMSVGRSDGGAWKLADGTVLIAGGVATNSVQTATTEIYDPKTHLFRAGPKMLIDRQGFAFVTLKDGRTLLAGGLGKTNSYQTLVESELFEPNTLSFKAAGPLQIPRSRARAVELLTGKVLITGGMGAGGTEASAVRQSETFDPVTGTWGELAEMSVGRINPAVVRLNDGRVMVIGGTDGTRALSSAEVYDPIARSWTLTAPMTTGRYFPSAISLRDGRVLVVGGSPYQETYSSTVFAHASSEIFDPTTGSWSPGPPLAQGRMAATLALDEQGAVFAINGNKTFYYQSRSLKYLYQLAIEPLRSVEILDPTTFTWSSGTDSSVPHVLGTFVELGDGRAILSGGISGNASYSSLEVYSFRTRSWEKSRSLSTTPGRFGQSAALLRDGRVLISGGASEAGSELESETYDPYSKLWSRAGRMNSEHFTDSSVRLGSDEILVAGTRQHPSELYDPETATWSVTAGLSRVRAQDASSEYLVVLPSGDAMFVGGRPFFSTMENALPDAEIYSHLTHTWRKVGSLNIPRASHAVLALPDGQVVVIGGTRSGAEVKDIEIFDPNTETWRLGPKTIGGRSEARAARLPDGRILVSGGYEANSPTTSMEICDLKLSVCTATASAQFGMDSHSLNTLWDGKVLKTSRGFAGGEVVMVAELFDPETQKWAPVPNEITGRSAASSLALLDGTILFYGGDCSVTRCPDIGFFEYFSPVRISPDGGEPPYRVTVSSGDALLDPQALFLKARSGGEVIVNVEDSAGQTADAKLTASAVDLGTLAPSK